MEDPWLDFPLVWAEFAGLGVKPVEFVVRLAYDAIVGVFLYIMDAVGFKRTVVARMSLESQEAVSVVAAQPVPSGEPYISFAVLYDMCHDCYREAVSIIEMLDLDILLTFFAEKGRNDFVLPGQAIGYR